MTYTFWHSGILIGESDLQEDPEQPRHRGGVFRPTPYGLSIFPRLTGILSAGHALKSHLEATGRSPESMDREEVEELLDNTPAGRKILDLGKTLGEVELRGPDGRRLAFTSIAFSDLTELMGLARELELESADELSELAELPELPPDAPRYLVSATLKDDPPDSVIRSSRRTEGAWRRFPAGDN